LPETAINREQLGLAGATDRAGSKMEAMTTDFVPPAEAMRRLGVEGDDWRSAARLFPVRWPAGYLDLAASAVGEPVRRMGTPLAAELVADPGDLADPVGEAKVSPHPFVVRKHVDRAILLVTARCHFYCRFCFRRSFPDGDHRDPTAAELDAALEHLLSDPLLEELILSGGDPLVLDDDRLKSLLDRVAGAEIPRSVRIHTRAPVHYPERVTDALVEVLSAGPPVWVVTHFNHAAELTAASLAALRRLRRAGIPLLNQSVLLAGVNDSVASLADLSRALYRAQVKPYYLHHPDRVPGSASFRVDIRRGLELHAGLRAGVSGPAVPSYVIDVPDGSGKVPVTELRKLSPGRYAAPSGYVYSDG
jgi:lysine 2,3-aminomutase